MSISLPHNWRPRAYQQEYMQHMFAGGNFPTRKRAQLVWHRRAGKDSTIINTLAVSSQMRIGTYWHMLPTLNQGRKVVWNGVDAMGRRIIKQAFPHEMIESINENDMLIRFKNGSFYQVVGSDNYDSLVGTNPLGVVFSEWSIADPQSWNFVRPILNENGGFAAFIYTPRGKNHAYDMWKRAQGDPRWFTSHKTILDTRREDGTPVITEEDIEQERREGVLEEVINQEYFCSFDGINVGSIYGKYLQKHMGNQRDFLAARGYRWNQEQLVFTAWDIGTRDAAAVWFYQIEGDEIHVIDYVEESGLDAGSWLEKLKNEFPYPLATPALPHDAKARTFASKHTTEQVFINEGLAPYIVKNGPRAHGINAVRALLPKIYFDTGNPNVVKGLTRLEMYSYVFDEKLKVFTTEPKHDEHSHGSDAFRMLALSVDVMRQAYRHRMSSTAKPKVYNTPVGAAYKLEELFREREMAMNSAPRRV